MTSTVESTVITQTGSQTGAKISHVSSSPTAAGINMTGIISIKNLPVSLTASNFTAPAHSARNINSSP